MLKYCTKMEKTIKLNFTMINLTLTWGCECYQKMEGKDRVTFGFIKFFSIYLSWVSCFYFWKITFFVTGNALLILEIFNNKTDIILFLVRKLLFFSYALLFTISLLTFLNYICHLKYLLLIYFFHCHVNHEW